MNAADHPPVIPAGAPRDHPATRFPPGSGLRSVRSERLREVSPGSAGMAAHPPVAPSRRHRSH